MVITARELINQAFRLLNINAIGDTLPDDDADEGLSLLNQMLANWNNHGAATFYILNAVYPLVANQQLYTIGEDVSADINAKRPVAIDTGFTRLTSGQTQPIDYPLQWINNEAWQSLPQKNITTIYPQFARYTPTWPLGTIELFPVPTVTLSLGLSQRMPLAALDVLDDDIDLPDGYVQAIRYNLAVEIAPQYGKNDKVSKHSQIWGRAMDTLADIKRINRRNNPVLVPLDASVVPKGRYSIYSDSYFRNG